MKIAIVGGIGSGKSTVIKTLSTTIIPGYRFYNVDHAVASLYENSHEFLNLLTSLGIKSKEHASDVAFSNPHIRSLLMEKAAELILPDVDAWLSENNVVVEFPLLYQFPEYVKKFDVVVSISATESIRQRRVKRRNPEFSVEKIQAIMRAQVPQDAVDTMADFVFRNSKTANYQSECNRLAGFLQISQRAKHYRERELQAVPDKPQKIGIISGSFDPITRGHLWLAERALSLVDKLYFVVADHPAKTYLLSKDERYRLMTEAVIEAFPEAADNDRCYVHSLTPGSFLVDYARAIDAKFIFRGVRTVTDLEYENTLNLMQRKVNPDVETIYFMPPRELTEVSSSLVRQIFRLKDSRAILSDYVPDVVLNYLYTKNL